MKKTSFAILVILISIVLLTGCISGSLYPTDYTSSPSNTSPTATAITSEANPAPIINSNSRLEAHPYPYPSAFLQLENISTPYPEPMFTPPTSAPRPTLTPTMVPVRSEIELPVSDLTWQECQISESTGGWGEACLGFSRDYRDENSLFGEYSYEKQDHVVIARIRQVIGDDVYETQNLPAPDYGGYTDQNGDAIYTLSKNGKVLIEKTTHLLFEPNLSLLNFDGKYVWQFADAANPTIIYDGLDLREAYNLDGASVPWIINDKLIFMAQKDGKYFVMYDGKQIGPDFDEVLIAYCCESAMLSIQRPHEQYWFRGKRGNKFYVVAITAKK